MTLHARSYKDRHVTTTTTVDVPTEGIDQNV